MKLDLRILDSSIKHIKGQEVGLTVENRDLEVVKEEDFGFQILIHGISPFFCSLEKTRDIHWQGLKDKVRVDISGSEEIVEMNFLGYIQNDDGTLIGDPILKNKALYIEEGYQMIWVSGKIPKGFSKTDLKLEVKAYYSRGYDKEELIAKENVNITVIDYVLGPVKEGHFYLDLWQHLCSWARAYGVDYFSDEHFLIIDNYIEELSALGQRVINLIVTDYPWAGQRCYQFEENASNLFEFNIVKVKKNKKGRINCDFSALDRYINICMKHGINEEINIFGILGNWDAYSFGNPIEGYRDPMRICYYDEKEECFDYIRSKDELKEYFSLLFAHLVAKGLWDKVKVISDEPANIELFQESVKFIEASIPEQKVDFKCAIHDQGFFEKFGENIQSLSLNTCEVINNMAKLTQIKEEINHRKGRLTWYSCCFPEDLNIFIKSPLIESRLIGWFTYYWDFEGFLRWAYAIWPTDPLVDIRYKYPKWNAGDMFLVYPGKDLKPMNSVRVKNLLFGIQDYNIFKEIEKSGALKGELMKELEVLLGKKEKMEFQPERSVKLEYSLNSKDYNEFRNCLIKRYLVATTDKSH